MCITATKKVPNSLDIKKQSPDDNPNPVVDVATGSDQAESAATYATSPTIEEDMSPVLFE